MMGRGGGRGRTKTTKHFDFCNVLYDNFVERFNFAAKCIEILLVFYGRNLAF